MRNYIKLNILILFFTFSAFAGDGAKHPKHINWPFEGALGEVDRQAAQRGFKVYSEACSACHALKHLYYRNLKDIGFSEAEIKELAKKFTVMDGPNEDGEMFEREAIPADKFVSPYPNEETARASNNGAYPPDLSLIVKSRHDGANYVYSLLTGYQDPGENIDVPEGLYYNPYFPGGNIAMPPPLTSNDQVEYIDGTNPTIEQMSRDVVVFLQWAAEPEMEHRKSMGLKVMIYLLIFTILFYIAKNRLWSRLKK